MAKSKVYAVAVGRSVGIFSSWTDCEKQVKGFSGAIFKSFQATTDAERFLAQHKSQKGKSKEVSVSNTATSSVTEKRPPPSSTNTIPPSKRLKISSSDSDFLFLLSFDGGSRGNPGVAGSGAEVILIRKKGNVKVRSKTRLYRFLQGNQTNNQAEYWGLITGLECVYDKLSVLSLEGTEKQDNRHRVSLAIQGDSRLIIQQMNGAFKVGPALLTTHQQAKTVMQKIQQLCLDRNLALEYTLEHVYRHDNQIADECANKAMDARKSWAIDFDGEGEETRKELTDVELVSVRK